MPDDEPLAQRAHDKGHVRVALLAWRSPPRTRTASTSVFKLQYNSSSTNAVSLLELHGQRVVEGGFRKLEPGRVGLRTQPRPQNGTVAESRARFAAVTENTTARIRLRPPSARPGTDAASTLRRRCRLGLAYSACWRQRNAAGKAEGRTWLAPGARLAWWVVSARAENKVGQCGGRAKDVEPRRGSRFFFVKLETSNRGIQRGRREVGGEVSCYEISLWKGVDNALGFHE